MMEELILNNILETLREIQREMERQTELLQRIEQNTRACPPPRRAAGTANGRPRKEAPAFLFFSALRRHLPQQVIQRGIPARIPVVPHRQPQRAVLHAVQDGLCLPVIKEHGDVLHV